MKFEGQLDFKHIFDEGGSTEDEKRRKRDELKEIEPDIKVEEDKVVGEKKDLIEEKTSIDYDEKIEAYAKKVYPNSKSREEYQQLAKEWGNKIIDRIDDKKGKTENGISNSSERELDVPDKANDMYEKSEDVKAKQYLQTQRNILQEEIRKNYKPFPKYNRKRNKIK